MAEIENYLSTIPFNIYINSSFNCTLYTNSGKKSQYESELNSYYQTKVQEKKNSFNNQIERAKWKNAVQAHGEMTCKGGHRLTDNVSHGSCGGSYFWVDGNTNTVICQKCCYIQTIGTSLVCSSCGCEANCYTRLQSGYRP